MKTTIFYFLFLIFALTGCGDDNNINNSNNNSNQTLFLVDSISLLISTAPNFKQDSVIFNYQNSVNVSFTLKTNVLDTSLSHTSNVLFWLITDSLHGFQATQIDTPHDTIFSFNFTNNQPWQIQFIKFQYELLVGYHTAEPCYLIIRNFKITALN